MPPEMETPDMENIRQSVLDLPVVIYPVDDEEILAEIEAALDVFDQVMCAPIIDDEDYIAWVSIVTSMASLEE
jgi:PII-like signaling protein